MEIRQQYLMRRENASRRPESSAKLPSTECRPTRPRRNRVDWKPGDKTPCAQSGRLNRRGYKARHDDKTLYALKRPATQRPRP